MKYTSRRRQTTGVHEPPMLRLENTPTDRKYQNASGERDLVVGASLEELERRLTAINKKHERTKRR